MQSDRYKPYRGEKISRKHLFLGKQDSEVTSCAGKKFTLLPGKSRDGREGTSLGHGAHGKVKKAQDEKLNVLAVKTPIRVPQIPKPLGEQGDNSVLESLARIAKNNRENEIRALEREFKFLDRLGDRTPTFVVTDESAYLFEAIIKGKPLCTLDGEGSVIDLLRESKCAPEKLPALLIKLAAMVIKVFSYLENLHEKDILHLDCFHTNILFDFDSFEGGIIDFGESIFFEEYTPAKKAELQIKIPHRSLEHLKLNDFEDFLLGFRRVSCFVQGCVVYLRQFQDLIDGLVAEFRNSREEKNADAKQPNEMVAYAKEKLKKFIFEICQTHGLQPPVFLLPPEVFTVALAPAPVPMVPESKTPEAVHSPKIVTHEQEKKMPATVRAKTAKDYFNDCCQAIIGFVKEKWRKLCGALCCCFPTASEVVYRELPDSAPDRASSTYTGPLQQFCGSAAQPAGNDLVVALGQAEQFSTIVSARVENQQHPPAVRRVSLSR